MIELPPMKKPRSSPHQTNSQETALISVWVPKSLIRELDAAAKNQDLDRSKVIRKALRQSLSRPA